MNEAANPLVSVVMPIHNAAPFLPACLASLQGQTYRNLDVICIDDGSTDAGAVIVKDAMTTDDRIRLISLDHGGPGRARNAGLDVAHGDYLAFLDADDTMPAHALERMLATIRGTGSDIVTGRVVRLTGTHTWPSTLHERAIPREGLRTHITRNTSLLYDTTSWNKLYAMRLWRDHSLRYPEGVLYEDVEVMIEAHTRARAVDMISDVVYHWRRRDDGTLSITQQRLQLDNLEDRMTSLRAVTALLADLGTPRLRKAAAYKALANDIQLYLRDLLRADRAYQERFVELVGDYLDDVPVTVTRTLPPQLAVEYHLLRAGQLDGLLRLLEHEQTTNGRLPAVRRGLSMHLDVGPVTSTVPPAVTRVRRRLPLRAGVDAVRGSGDSMVIEGYAFLHAVPMTSPVSQLRRLKLTEVTGERTMSVWLKPRRHERATARFGGPGIAYTWSGFRAEIPVDRLAPPPGITSATWAIAVQAVSPLAAKGSALGPPAAGAAWFPAAHRTADGLVCSAGWGQDERLRLTVRRSPGAVTGASSADGRLRLELRLDSPAARTATDLVLRGIGESPIVVPIRRVAGAPGRLAVAEVDVSGITSLRREAPFTVLEVALRSVSGSAIRLDTDLAREIVVNAGGADTVLVRGDSAGRAEIAITAARVAVTDAHWRDDDLVLSGMITLPAGQEAELEWRNGRGERLPGVETRTGDRFEAVFRPLAVPGAEGEGPLTSGNWELFRRDGDTGAPTRAFVARGCQAGVERAHRKRPMDLRLWVDRHSLVSMVVHVLEEDERGPYAQDQLRRGPYRRARDTALRDAVLFESWQGKQYSDNPRALVEEALRRHDPRELIVSVRDPAVRTPPGVRPVLLWSRAYYEALATSRTVIANDSMTAHFVKRKGQRYIQTWHGTPLKRIGFDIETIHFRNRRYLEELALETRKWDQLVSPNPYTTQILRSAFHFDGEILETGYPRNDLLLRAEAQEVRRRTRELLDVPDGTKAVLWAPTWRDNQFGEAGGYSFPMILDVDRLRQRLGDEYVILFRGHHLISNTLRSVSGEQGFLRNVSGHPDIRDLYCASDALITDYSSTMFDYALTGKPMLYFVWDLDSYRDRLRGLYVDLAEIAPGPLLADGDELAAALRDLPAVTQQHAAAYGAFRTRFGGLEDGHSAARVWDLIDASGLLRRRPA
jgi:CDP-glycerol glycerophosphotransferase